jgi:methionyl aminopeptidase
VLCTSVNAVVVHGIADRRQALREGDVVGIDFACYKDGYCADAARTVAVGIAIQGHAEELGYPIVRDFVGHGIGRAMHEPPSVPNHGRVGSGLLLRPGLVLAIEPMLNVGGAAVRVLRDGWKVVTADGRLSAHVEHTVAVTEEGARVVTGA